MHKLPAKYRSGNPCKTTRAIKEDVHIINSAKVVVAIETLDIIFK